LTIFEILLLKIDKEIAVSKSLFPARNNLSHRESFAVLNQQKENKVDNWVLQ